jgi:hypothetical protein
MMTYGAIDLTLCSPIIAYNCEYIAFSELYDSDNFPTAIKINTNGSTSHENRFPRKFDLADWYEHSRLINLNLPPPDISINADTHRIDNIIEEIIAALRKAGDQSIPKTT